MRAFRRFRHRHTLRIGINDVIRDRPLEEVTRELVAPRGCLHRGGAAARAAQAWRLDSAHRPEPDGRPARLTVLAFGKLGGDELNYSSDIDLMFVYDDDGETTGRRGGLDQQRVLRPRGHGGGPAPVGPHRSRLRVPRRPAAAARGQSRPARAELASTLSYYDTMGRTWERQALIKLRHVGGDADLAREFLAAIEPFVYRKYFSFAEINEVKALKRQMEQRGHLGRRDAERNPGFRRT